MKLELPAAGATVAILLSLCTRLCTPLSAAQPAPAADETRPAYGLEDLLSLSRLSDSQVSPDGRLVVYARRMPILEKNSFESHLWIIPSAGGAPRQLTSHEKGESRPRWSPDGKTIAFLSSRGGSPQIWAIPIDGGEARQVTSLSTGADSHVWSPTGSHLAFTSDVWPDLPGGDAAQKKRADEIEASGVKAQVIDHLLYRHWNDWRHGKRTHVFVVPAAGGEARDVTPGDLEAPPFSLGGPDTFAISPDGRELVFTRGPARAVEAWSTNADLWAVPIAGGEPARLTTGPGWDGSPAWSPDGRFIAFRSQAREGYEADATRLALLERATGQVAYLAGELDRSVDEILWEPRGNAIRFVVEDEGRTALYSVGVSGLRQTGSAAKLFGGFHVSSLSQPADGSFYVGELQSLVRPSEVVRLDVGAGAPSPKPLTAVNDALLSQRRLASVESVRFPGARGDPVQAWLLKPPGHEAGKRSPFLLFIHGGPQSAWQDAFSFRWNAALYAARGYVVLMPNPRGSTGFGQSFTEQISGDWPGACYEDLMKAADWAVEQGLADPARMAAMGGSFGGYMVNWILGHTDRFRALVSHAGVYNLESMYGATEELWFPEWDLGGPPWKDRGDYAKFSPHRFAAKFRTPTLVIHGELDYRVPVAEGMQLFTALKRQGVEAKFLYYPDEGHWVLKPKNAKLWNETVLAWLDAHLKG